MSRLAVDRDTGRYAGACPRVTQPKEVAHFSRDTARSTHFDRRSLRRYRQPRLPVALDDGFMSYVPRAPGAPLSDVLEALAHQSISASTHNVVTYRNNLNKLFLTPLNPNDDWEIGVTRHAEDTILLEVRETARKTAEEAARTERERRMCYWGYKFEQLCTLEPSADENDGGAAGSASAEAVDANEEFCSIVSLGLDRLKLIVCAEIDAVDEIGAKGEGGAKESYVEFKTTKLIRTPRDRTSFERYKLLKFWLQSYLAGVPRILCGFRDDAGSVTVIEAFETLSLHRLVRGKPHAWDPSVCLNFGAQALSWLLREMRHVDVGGTRLLRYEPATRELVLAAHGVGEPCADGPPAKQPRREESL